METQGRPLRSSSMLEHGRSKQPALSETLVQRLRSLGELREQGLLTQDEFTTQKQKLLRR